jgi:hypothetical protein
MFGGRDSHSGRYMRPSINFRETRDRPTPEESKNMSREDREKAEFEGVIIDNDDLKDIAEDIQDVAEDVGKFMDLNRPLNQESLKLDAAVRFSKPVQTLMKTVLKDFGINTKEDFRKAARIMGHAIEEGIENCPMLPRVRKAAERLFRFYASKLEITDLPTGKRMRWVNELVKKLYSVMQDEEPVRQLYRMLDRVEHDVERSVSHYMRDAERMEQKFNKNGGI